MTQRGEFSLERDAVAVPAVQANPWLEARSTDEHGAVGGRELHSRIVVITKQHRIGVSGKYGGGRLDRVRIECHAGKVGHDHRATLERLEKSMSGWCDAGVGWRDSVPSSDWFMHERAGHTIDFATTLERDRTARAEGHSFRTAFIGLMGLGHRGHGLQLGHALSGSSIQRDRQSCLV
jgi:hypothetical protein